MGTKLKPGKFDCYNNAEPDEPMFVLLGRDPLAPLLVELWADVRANLVTAEGEEEKLTEARACAKSMRNWPVTKKLKRKVCIEKDAYWEIVSAIVQNHLGQESEVDGTNGAG